MSRSVPTGLLALTAALALLPAGTAGAAARDRDHDGLPDRWEHRHHVSRPGGDPDRDGLRNRAELLVGMDPRDADSDGDGVRDGEEGAGVIRSVDGSRVTLALAAGGVRTATIDPDDTDVVCDDPSDDGGDDAMTDPDVIVFTDDGGDDATGTDDDGGGFDDGDAETVTVPDCAGSLVPGATVYESELDGATYALLDLVRP